MEKTLILKNKKGGKNWIQGAVNPEHEGYCTPMTKSTCTPRRKAFAMTMKEHHGFHKKDGGDIENSYVPISQNGSKLVSKSKVKTGHVNVKNKEGQKGFFEGTRTIIKTPGMPNDTLYQYFGKTPIKTELFNYSTSKQAPINQLNFNGKLSSVSPDSVRMYRERVNNLAGILPPRGIW